MTRLMQDDQVIRASQHLVKKLSQDVKTMMIYRQNTTIGRDQFSKLMLEASSEDCQDGVEFLDDIIAVFRKHHLPGEAFLLQAKARFVIEVTRDYYSAIETIQQAIQLAPKIFVLHDSQAQIRKKEMKNIMRTMDDMSRETWCEAFSLGTHAISDFIKAQELYDQSRSTFVGDYPDTSDITLSKSPGLFGEVETSLAIAELLIESLCSSEEDQSEMRAFLKLQNVRVEHIFEKKGIFTHDLIRPFVENLHGQIVNGLKKIIKNLDSRSIGGHFDELKELGKHTLKFEKLFFVSYFDDLYDQLCDTDKEPWEKIDLIEKYIKLQPLESLIYTSSQTTGYIELLVLIMKKFQKIAADNGLAVKNSVKMAMLNINISSEAHNLLEFEESQKFSLDLAKRKHDCYENYFYYLLMFLSDKTNRVSCLDLYEEDYIIHCAERINEIKEDKSWTTSEGIKKYDHHDYLYYLTTKPGYERIKHFDHRVGHRLPDAAIIDGIIVDNLIEMELPEGSTIRIRTSRRPFFIKNLNTKHVTFELVFALNGLVAWNVKAKHSDRESYRDFIQENNQRKMEKNQTIPNQVFPSPEERPRERRPHPSGEDQPTKLPSRLMGRGMTWTAPSPTRSTAASTQHSTGTAPFRSSQTHMQRVPQRQRSQVRQDQQEIQESSKSNVPETMQSTPGDQERRGDLAGADDLESTSSLFNFMDLKSTSLQYRTTASGEQALHRQDQQCRQDEHQQQPRQPLLTYQHVPPHSLARLPYQQHLSAQQEVQLQQLQHPPVPQPSFQQQPNQQMFYDQQQMQSQMQQHFQQRNPGPISRPAPPPQPPIGHFPPLGSPQQNRPRPSPPPGFPRFQGQTRRTN